ncbi:MAG TPA: hypothetical protein VMZ30_17220 [Pyrinomonadaceae bacterium]|nr:hypothetical protein [Pyrinomonadaceae bacterium]
MQNAKKHPGFGLALILFVIVASQLSYGQESLGPRPKKARTPADYQLRTLKDIAASDAEARSPVADTERGFPTGDEKVTVNGDIRPSRVRATYAGRSRPMPQNKKDVLHRWAQLYAGAPTHYTVPYKSELLFKADGVNYWLAFKKDSIAHFKKRIKTGKAVDLFLIRLGGTLDSDSWEPLLLVESFQKPE